MWRSLCVFRTWPAAALCLAGSLSPVWAQVPGHFPKHHRAYHDPHNADGSLRYEFFGAGGFTKPTGQTADNFASGFRFGGGAGHNWNRRVGAFLQFDWDGLSVRNAVLGQLLPVYQQACGTSCTGSVPAKIFGSSHIWSFSLDPVATVAGGSRRTLYVTGGPGFYHKVTDFSAPGASSTGNGGAQYPTIERIDQYTSNAAGVSVGAGATQLIAHSDVRFFAEARYVHIFNDPRPGNTAARGTGFNAFPANSQPTDMIPVTFGIRF